MIIQLTKKETMSLMNVMNSVQENSVDELKELLKDNNVINYKVSLTGSVELHVKPEYMEDFLVVYEKFVKIFVTQAKALYETVCLFQTETEQVVNKYLEKEE